MEQCLTEESHREEIFVAHCIDEAVLVSPGELGLIEDIARIEVSERAKGMNLFQDEYLSISPRTTVR